MGGGKAPKEYLEEKKKEDIEEGKQKVLFAKEIKREGRNQK